MNALATLTEGVRQAARPSLTASIRAVVAMSDGYCQETIVDHAAPESTSGPAPAGLHALRSPTAAVAPTMSQVERCLLAHRVADALCAVADDARVDLTLSSFGLRRLADAELTGTSRSARILEAIAEASDDVIAGLSEVLVHPPMAWKDRGLFRLFISHLAKDRESATRLRDCLAPLRICGFVAHEDVQPTAPWQDELHRALMTMDAFLAIHTEGYGTSTWAQQEVGFALGRGTQIISFKMSDEAPAGFIAGEQALLRQGRTAEQVAPEIRNLLAAGVRTRERLAFTEAAADVPARSGRDNPF